MRFKKRIYAIEIQSEHGFEWDLGIYENKELIMSDHCDFHQHPNHKKQISRLNRISGQLAGVKKMIEGQRYCPEILKQLKAARSAIKSLEENILETHLANCVVDAFSSKNNQEKNKKIAELTELFKWSD